MVRATAAVIETAMERLDDNATGNSCRSNASAHLAARTKVVLGGLVAVGMLLLAALLLWKVLEAAGDGTGASTFFAMTLVVGGVWAAHWLGLILLNSFSVTELASKDR